MWGWSQGRACSRRHDLPAKGRDERKEPNGGWQDWIWKFNASNISAGTPALGHSLSQTSRLSGCPSCPYLSLYRGRPRHGLASSPDSFLSHMWPLLKAFPIFDVRGESLFLLATVFSCRSAGSIPWPPATDAGRVDPKVADKSGRRR